MPDGDVDAAPGPVTRLPFCPWCVGKSYSRTAVGADPDRTSRRVPDVLNATCVVPDPPRDVVMLPGAVRAAKAGFVGFVRT